MFDTEPERSAPAITTEWSPLKRGGTNFRTHRLVTIDADTAVFKATAGTIIFATIFLAFGIIPICVAFWLASEHGSVMRTDVLVPLLFGIAFGALGLFLMSWMTRPAVFDRHRGYFWKGRKDPDAVWNKDELKHFCEIRNIQGLQIISELVKGDKGSFNSYELNLVLKDGSRMNVIDHGNERMLRSDAQTLAEFLGVEVLNPTASA